ncbi:MAG: hypothetical protein ISS65_12635 [Desulfobacterales bacterium]|nr:hypothetical protein [Desulfobacterales bacterium]
MTKRLNVSDEFQKEYRQLLRLLYGDLQNDTDIQNIIKVYLKFGGDKLARPGIEIINKRFQKELQESIEESQMSDAIDAEDDIPKDPQKNSIPYSESDDLDDDDDKDGDDYPLDY